MSPDPLADVLAALDPARLLAHPAATGAGVRVGVVDSGVERETLLARSRRGLYPAPQLEGVILRPDGGTDPYDGRQSGPHGTVVADAILSHAPQASLLSVDVFGPAGGCTAATLVRGIRHAVAAGCDVVNLSLGLAESDLSHRRAELMAAIQEGYFRGRVMVAAVHNAHPHAVAYPAGFAAPLLPVNRGAFESPAEFAYVLSEPSEFEAFARGGLGPFGQTPATSWAAAHLSGIAAQLMSLRPGMKPFELKTLLYWMHQRRVAGGTA